MTVSAIAECVADRAKHSRSGHSVGSCKEAATSLIALEALSEGGGGSGQNAVGAVCKKLKSKVRKGRISTEWTDDKKEIVAQVVEKVFLNKDGYRISRYGSTGSLEGLCNKNIKDLCDKMKIPMFTLKDKQIKNLLLRYVPFNKKFCKEDFVNSRIRGRDEISQGTEGLEMKFVLWTDEQKKLFTEAVRKVVCKEGDSTFKRQAYPRNSLYSISKAVSKSMSELFSKRTIVPFFIKSAVIDRLVGDYFQLGKKIDIDALKKIPIKSEIYVSSEFTDDNSSLSGVGALGAVVSKVKPRSTKPFEVENPDEILRWEGALDLDAVLRKYGITDDMLGGAESFLGFKD